MRFLIVTKAIHPLPVEHAPMLAEAMQTWADTHRASGKMEQIWAFAGLPSGCGILNVDSHEELDDIMLGFPFANWSDTQVYVLSDIDHTMASFRAASQQQ
jgi:muconolactone delta-isomerase